MIILHMVSGLDPKSGGPTRSISGLCRTLAASGVETILFAYSPSHDLINPCGVRFVKGRGTGIFTASRDAQMVIREVKPDVIHLHGIWIPTNHIASCLAKRHHIPVFISPRGMLEPWSLNAKKWKKRLALVLYQRRDLKAAAALHATAESEADQFKRLGFKQPIITLPNGVDFPDTMPPRTHRGDGKRTALFLSRIHPKKGLMELLEAWARVKSQQLATGNKQLPTNCSWNQALTHSRTHALLNWHFEYAGPDYDGHLAAVQKRMRELGVEADFTYLGNLNDTEKWAAYRRADLFVLPTYSENFGIVVAEALAAGVPVLTTTGTPWKALVEHQCGWWIEPGVDALTEALPKVLATATEDLAAKGERGRRYAVETFAWESIADQMKRAYEWVLNGGVPPSCVKLD
jgi:glycosyltransferase involved in cell wall biosynthesis